MKRIGNVYEQIISVENLQLADQKARKGKGNQQGVKLHDKRREENVQQLHHMLRNRTFRTSEYTTFKVYEPKERVVFRLPYFPDRIVHHAIMNALEPIFLRFFTADTYSCIKGKGIHGAHRAVRKALSDVSGTTYCLKLDIRKFYPSVDHQVLKAQLRRKFKDADLLWLLDEIIDSAEGLPIGNYLSQHFANFYLTWFDNWIKTDRAVRYYFRYADDIVILAPSKGELHELLAGIRNYLHRELRLEVKGNYQVFPVAARGIDFVGYRFYHSHTLLRKSIKKNFARTMARRPNRASLAAYMGWAKHCNSKNLIKTLLDDKTIQRLRDQADADHLPGRQDQDRPDTEQRDHGPRLQDRTVEVRGKQAHTSDRSVGRAPGDFHR